MSLSELSPQTLATIKEFTNELDRMFVTRAELDARLEAMREAFISVIDSNNRKISEDLQAAGILPKEED